MSFAETALAFGSAFVVFGVLLIAALLYQKHLGIVPGDPVSMVTMPITVPTPARTQTQLHVVMSPREYHYRHVQKFQARERERNAAGTQGTRYLTESRSAVYRKHATGKALTRDDLLILAPVRKADATKLYAEATRKPDNELSDPEFVARYSRVATT